MAESRPRILVFLDGNAIGHEAGSAFSFSMITETEFITVGDPISKGGSPFIMGGFVPLSEFPIETLPVIVKTNDGHVISIEKAS